jgi:hypothetical protein
MFEWVLQYDISWLQNIATTCEYKNYQDVWIFVFYPIEEFLTLMYSPTI